MDEHPASGADAPPPSRLRATNTFLALVILLLLGQMAWQQMRISSLKADLEQSQRDLATKVERLALEKVQTHREEMVTAVAFVDDLYRSADGLQRRARIEGKSDQDARQSIADAIKGSDEWRRKHATK
jgi:predicted Holliday junction resolvase-like endonuclease